MATLAPVEMKHATLLRSSTEPALSPSVAVECVVKLDGMEVMADIGVLAAEQGLRQPLILFIELTTILPIEDVLDETIDYREVARAAGELADQRIALIETFARRLALRCLEHPRVLAADVRIEKPRAVPGALAGTRVRLTRLDTVREL